MFYYFVSAVFGSSDENQEHGNKDQAVNESQSEDTQNEVNILEGDKVEQDKVKDSTEVEIEAKQDDQVEIQDTIKPEDKSDSDDAISDEFVDVGSGKINIDSTPESSSTLEPTETNDPAETEGQSSDEKSEDNNALKFVNEHGETIDDDKLEDIVENDDEAFDGNEEDVQEMVQENNYEEPKDTLENTLSQFVDVQHKTVESETQQQGIKTTVTDNYADEISTGIDTVFDTVTDITESVMTTSTSDLASELSSVEQSTAISTDAYVAASQVQLDTDEVFVIDGTTFGADFYDTEATTSSSETPSLQTTMAFEERTVLTVADSLAPTETYEQILNTETLYDSTTPVAEMFTTPVLTESQIENSDEHKESTSGSSFETTIEPSETVNTFTDSTFAESDNTAHVLGTSFGYVTQSSLVFNTLLMDTEQSGMETELLSYNETVVSDNVHDQVQPSLDQNAYLTDVYLSRKPLSTGLSEASTDTVLEDLDTKNAQAEDVEQPDINNNVDKFSQGTTEPIPVDLTPPPPTGQDIPNEERILSRKVPDPALDEETVQTSESFMKTLEPWLKMMIEMVRMLCLINARILLFTLTFLYNL